MSLRIAKQMIERLMPTFVYTVPPPSLIAGLKRRGGLGFIPKRTLTQEHMFLKSLDLIGKTIYDVGGHVGLITMFFARAAGESGRVITFEPNPQNYEAILDHIKINDLTNVKVIRIGLADTRAKQKFVVTDSALGTAETDRQNKLLEDKNAQVYEIFVDTMDNQITVHKLPKPDFVKIDVEGLEYDVLLGMSNTISCFRPEMSIELHGIKERKIAEFLLSHYHRIYQVEDGIDITAKNIDKVHGHLYVHS